uniref:Uncharacterized protein n=1 Tax=Rhizophora mucronata TaxID=61149 RepID=A0A2P2PVV2_RHIMU
MLLLIPSFLIGRRVFCSTEPSELAA